jgi:hypothetical protein
MHSRVIILLALAAAAARAGEVSVRHLAWTDPARHREVPVTIYAQAMAFADLPRKGGPLSADLQHHRIICEATTAFWDAYLLGRGSFAPAFGPDASVDRK